jgi:formiminotetrahydrofolate cyclodeaminase
MGRASFRSATLDEFVAELGGPGPAPAAGAAAGAALAFAAALVELALDRQDPARERAAELRQRALELVDLDVNAYRRLVAAQRQGEDADLAAARRDASVPPLQIAETAAEVGELAEQAERHAPDPRRADAVAAVSLARGSRLAALSLVDANQGEGS